MTITHIFFDLHGTLIDGRALHGCYSAQLGRVLAHRFGGSADVWANANRRVMMDWDSYYTDLDLAGERGLDDMWEGLLRTTRAMFRLANIEPPPMPVLKKLARELPGLATRNCNALYPEAKDVIQALCAAGYMLGVTTHAVSSHARGVLNGGDVTRYFAAPIITPDVAGQFEKDEAFYAYAARAAGVAQQCLTIDDSPRCVEAARGACMQAIYLNRRDRATCAAATHVLYGSLSGLLDILGVQNPTLR